MEQMQISEQARTIRNRYQRQWRRKNADKLRNYNVVYWEKKATEVKPEQVAEQAMLFR